MPDVSSLGHSPEPAATEPSPSNVKTASHPCRGRGAPGRPLYVPRWHTGLAAVRPGQNSLSDNHWGQLNPQLGPGADGRPSPLVPAENSASPHRPSEATKVHSSSVWGEGCAGTEGQGAHCPGTGHSSPQDHGLEGTRGMSGAETRGRCGPRPSHLST